MPEIEKYLLEKKLESLKRLMNDIVHRTDIPKYVVNHEDRIIDVNRPFEQLFGYLKDDVAGRVSTILTPADEKYVYEYDEIRQKLQDKGFAKVEETFRVSKCNRTIPVKLTYIKLDDDYGNFGGYLCTMKDLSESRNDAGVVTNERYAFMSRLAELVAHELQNPLASIYSVVQVLMRRVMEKEDNDLLLSIKDNVDRVSNVIKTVVEVARGTTLERTYIVTNELVLSTVERVKMERRNGTIEFDFELGEDIPQLFIVPSQIMQVLDNIISSSIEAMQAKGKIMVKTYTDDVYVNIEIIDDGPGMSEEKRKHLFKPFFHSEKLHSNTEIGLILSYGVVNKFNGDIIVESKEGAGSKFIIKLPIR